MPSHIKSRLYIVLTCFYRRSWDSADFTRHTQSSRTNYVQRWSRSFTRKKKKKKRSLGINGLKHVSRLFRLCTGKWQSDTEAGSWCLDIGSATCSLHLVQFSSCSCCIADIMLNGERCLLIVWLRWLYFGVIWCNISISFYFISI